MSVLGLSAFTRAAVGAAGLGLVGVVTPAGAPTAQAAVPAEADPDNPSVGEVWCCNSIADVNDSMAVVVAESVGVALPEDGSRFGLNCVQDDFTPCAAQPVRCAGPAVNGLIVMDCSPFSREAGRD